ncbi:SDR family NAD(P)-dependent oxidoreductase [Sphingomonas colocasiae]|uniref:SDR family oxidoreductase n=1 Tax=Sphingomonas colocasiae TaxID=1848973 RepID=A0ABS7PUB7_9SPHN|nr:SDR family oxidoreductase [Sphingomonas colocasiae]MBY8823589.1 SDR family oxidoreductase [Sphingomonas colocasiae]
MSGKTLVITGGSRGIGHATASRFADAGYGIVNLSRSPAALPGVIDIAADFADPAWAEAVAAPLCAAITESESICLIHNSALQVPGDTAEIDIDGLRRSLEINVVAPAALNRVVLPLMRPGSSILYVGSTLSQRATRGMAAYATSKHAVAGLMRSTAQDLAGTGIHTACICPGFTNTEMLQSYGGEALSHLASLVTQKRLIAPEEIAELLFHAARNPVVNGSMIQADLGFIEP